MMLLIIYINWVYVGDYFYYKVSETRYQRNRSNYLEFVSGDEVRIGLDEGEMSVSIEENGDDSFAFAFSDGRSVRGNWNDEDLVDSDGVHFFLSRWKLVL